MSIEEIERVVAQQVANAIEAIAIYETKTNLACKSMSQTERQEEEVAENASNKRKWESNHNGSLSQQNKDIRMRASKPKTMQDAIEIATKLRNKKIGTLAECQTKNKKRNPTCYVCGNQGHYRSDCPELKNQDHGNQTGGTGAHGMVHALGGGETNQDINDVEDDINA
nr:hypothetical protein [Tanacetum cinerariifolium]